MQVLNKKGCVINYLDNLSMNSVRSFLMTIRQIYPEFFLMTWV